MPLITTPDCDLTLYTHPWSRGQIARWMLEETGQPYRQVILDFGTTMKAPDYLALNPMGKVPTVVHDQQVVTECAAICTYLAEAFPTTQLMPKPDERANYYRWLFFAAGPLEASISDRFLGVQIKAEQERTIGYGNFAHVMDTLALWLARTPFVSGPRFTAADVYVGSQLMWGMQFGTLPKRPEFEDYAARLSQRSAYQTAKSIDMDLGTQIAQKKP
jgi:glutathione S-transferase